jgi:RNA polymerase sigma factor (sigma-70 family)
MQPAMSDVRSSAAAVSAALAGELKAVRALVGALSPVVQARVARGLLRSGARSRLGIDLRQEVEDFTQEVFAALFADDGRVLREWDPERGLSLANYVGLVAEHQVASILRSRRRNPWTDEPTDDADLVRAAGVATDTDRRLHSRELLAALHERLRAELTVRGLHLFQLLLVEERSVESVCAETKMTPDAVYAWRSRLGKLVRKLADEIVGPTSDSPAAQRSPQGEPSAP